MEKAKMKTSIFDSYKETMSCLILILGIVIVSGLTLLVIINNNYYSQFGDDNAQYFPFMKDFVIRFKANRLSFYSFSNYLGSSYFVDTYYVSFDIFSLLSVIFSFFMPFSFAFGLQEFSKLFVGVILFAVYLHMRGRGNKAVFFGALLYGICGANVINQAFPIYYSLIAYLPATAIIMEYFHRGKKFILPLYICSLVFYNYYNAYLCIIFAFFLLLIHYAIDYKKENKSFALEFGSFCLLGILGVLMGAIVLIPSALAILRDTTKGSGMAIDFSQLFIFKDNVQYLRLLGELFTPAISTDYWGFSNNGWYSYINMHLSIYMTITGLLIALSVYFLHDRESSVFKVIMPLEIIVLFMPLFYMLFSGSNGTYTRWFVMITFFNIMIAAKVIDETNFNFYKVRYKQLIKNIVVFIICLIVLILYVDKVYSTNIFNYFFNITSIEPTLKINPGFVLNLQIDCVFLIVALVLIILGTVSCFVRKVNIMPYLLSVELVVGMVFFYMAPFRTLNFLIVDEKRNSVNDYLNDYSPFTSEFYRIYCGPQIDKGGDGQNFNRTQLQLTTMKNFHSWHTAASHEFTHLMFGTEITTNASSNDDNPYLDMQQLFGTKYVLSNANQNLGLPSHYEYVEGSKTNEYKLYENTKYTPFVVYDTILNAPYSSKPNGEKDYYLKGDNFDKTATLLSYVYYVGEDEEVLTMPKSSEGQVSVKNYSHKYTTGDKNAPWTAVSGNYLIYELDMDTNDKIPSSGAFIYYFGSQFATTFSDVYLGTKNEDGTYTEWKSCFGSYPICYYDKLPEQKVYLCIRNTQSMINRRNGDDARLELGMVYYSDSYLEDFFNRQDDYPNRVAKYNGSGLDIAFNRETDKDIIISIPVAYSDCFKTSTGYKVINVNGGMTGVYIPKEAGNHISFTLKYTPWGLKQSAIISAASFALYGGYLVYDLKIRKKEEK